MNRILSYLYKFGDTSYDSQHAIDAGPSSEPLYVDLRDSDRGRYHKPCSISPTNQNTLSGLCRHHSGVSALMLVHERFVLHDGFYPRQVIDVLLFGDLQHRHWHRNAHCHTLRVLAVM
jgi:hypothetical protein